MPAEDLKPSSERNNIEHELEAMKTKIEEIEKSFQVHLKNVYDRIERLEGHFNGLCFSGIGGLDFRRYAVAVISNQFNTTNQTFTPNSPAQEPPINAPILSALNAVCNKLNTFEQKLNEIAYAVQVRNFFAHSYQTNGGHFNPGYNTPPNYDFYNKQNPSSPQHNGNSTGDFNGDNGFIGPSSGNKIFQQFVNAKQNFNAEHNANPNQNHSGDYNSSVIFLAKETNISLTEASRRFQELIEKTKLDHKK